MKAECADGFDQADDINFPGRSSGEFQVFGEFKEDLFGEKDRADGKVVGVGLKRRGTMRFFNIFIDNSIYTIIMASKRIMGHKIKIQRVDRGTTKSYYVNFPAALAEAAQIEKGEELEWLMEDRNTFVLRRATPIKSILKRGKSLT